MYNISKEMVYLSFVIEACQNLNEEGYRNQLIKDNVSFILIRFLGVSFMCDCRLVVVFLENGGVVRQYRQLMQFLSSFLSFLSVE